MPDNVICILPALAHFIPTRALGNRYRCYPFTTEKKTKGLAVQKPAQGHSQQTVEPGIRLRSNSKTHFLAYQSTSHKKIPLKIPKVTTDIKLGHAVVTKMM